MKKPTYTRFYKLLISPFAFALPFALITILLLPFEFQKYQLNPESKRLAEKHTAFGRTFFEDLDFDGVSEEIINFKDFPDFNAIKVKIKDNILLDQWNFTGDYDFTSVKTFFVDYDHDSLTEIFTIYSRNDSLFIGAFQPFDDKLFYVKDYFLDTIWNINGKVDFGCEALTGHDIDKDGDDEIIFSINAGFSKYPRRIYAWNIRKNTLLKSPNKGFKNSRIHFLDVNDDGYDEIISSTFCQNNIKPHDSIPFPDNCLWFCVFDKNMNFWFDPVKVSPGTGNISVLITDKTGKPNKILIECFNRNSDDRYSYFYFNPISQKLDPIEPDFNRINHNGLQPFILKDKSGFLLTDYETGIFWVDENLNTIKHLYKTKTNKSNPLHFDIDGDGSDELLLFDGISNFAVISGDFSYHTDFEAPIIQKLQQVSIRHLSTKVKHLVIQTDQVIQEFGYQYNPLWLLKWPLNLFIYLLYVLTFRIILHYQNKHIENKYKLAKNLAELRLKSIRNQMDPHFTFNAINSIGAAIFNEDKNTAYNYFSKFSKLLRLTMLYSDRMSRSLSDEIDFTVKYLEIEKFRYKEKFDYQINIDADVEQYLEVPRMVLQTFAESAVNNGLMHRIENGQLRIDISMKKDLIILSITDNGGGIEKSKLLNEEKAFKSVKIIDEFFGILNSFNTVKATYEMKDLVDGNKINGTQVIVYIPVNLKYTF